MKTRELSNNEATRKKKSREMLSIIDFNYVPFALGDAFTWQVKMSVEALNRGVEKLTYCMVTDEDRPGNKYQNFINEDNIRVFLDNLFPAFLCNPMAGSIHVIRTRMEANRFLLRWRLQRGLMLPTVFNHIHQRIDFTAHHEINDFYHRNQYIPNLSAPRGYETVADEFIQRYCAGKFVVTVNIRQRAMLGNHAALHRDSPVDAWVKFFRVVKREQPDVIFLILGGYNEWERRLYREPNVLIPRALGGRLGEELALMHASRMFMGTSSGFAAMATFSQIPYIITNYEHAVAPFVGLEVGEERYPFARDLQILSWQRETDELLIEKFKEMYFALK